MFELLDSGLLSHMSAPKLCLSHRPRIGLGLAIQDPPKFSASDATGDTAEGPLKWYDKL